MIKTVTITVVEVGQQFAVAARVRSVSEDREIHRTNDFPYGFDTVAVRAAEVWAQSHGYTVVGVESR